MMPNENTKPHGVPNATVKARPKIPDSSWVLPVIGFAVFTSMDAFRNFQMVPIGALMCLLVNFVFNECICDRDNVNSLRRCIGCLRIMFFMSIVYYGHAFVGLMSKGSLPGFVPYIVKIFGAVDKNRSVKYNSMVK